MGLDRRLRPLFILLLATVVVHHWFASTPWPLGGPNVILGVLTALLGLCHVLSRGVAASVAAQPPQGSRGLVMARGRSFVSGIVGGVGPAGPAIAAALLLLAWSIGVHLCAGQAVPVELAQLGLGIGVLAAAALAVDTIERAAWTTLAFVLSTFVSAVFGFAVVAVGDPFLGAWLSIADVRPASVEKTLLWGRLAGLATDASAFSAQLVVAAPLAFAALVHAPSAGPKWNRPICRAALYAALATMIAATVVSGFRSVAVGCLVSVVVVAVTAARLPAVRRRLLAVPALLAFCLLAVSNPFFSLARLVDGMGGGDQGDRPPHLADLAATTEDALADRAIGHKIVGLPAGERYVVQLRVRDDRGLQTVQETAGRAGRNGSVAIAWRPAANPGLASYELRLRQPSSSWSPWRRFEPSQDRLRPRIRALSPRGDAVVLDGIEYPPDVDIRRRPTPDGAAARLIPGQRYAVQVRAQSEHGYGPPSEIAAIANDAGVVSLTWRAASAGDVFLYQYRLRAASETRWDPWRLVTDGVGVSAEGFAKGIMRGRDRPEVEVHERLLDFPANTDWTRLAMPMIAWRHALDQPFGSGVFLPLAAFQRAGHRLTPDDAQVLVGMPRNQLLHATVVYGYPGLALLAAFYFCVLGSLFRSCRVAVRAGDARRLWLVAAVAGTLAAYGIHSLLHGFGPLRGDWGHFILVGLTFAVVRIVGAGRGERRDAMRSEAGGTGVAAPERVE